MEPVLLSNENWAGLLGGAALALVTILAKRYLIPFLRVGKRRRYAEFIVIIADDLTDELRQKYPDTTWLAHLDEAVDRLVEICGVDTGIAERAIKAAAARK